MISVMFVSKDKTTGDVLKSQSVYFQEFNSLVSDIVKTNQEVIQRQFPNSRVFALIQNEGEKDDYLFI
jgi:hypothetical protein